MRAPKRKYLGACVATATVIGALLLAQPTLAKSKSAGRGPDVETRIKTLHSELRITTEQEAAWNDVAKAMRENARRMTDVRRQQEEMERNASAPAVIEAYGKTMDAHAEAVRQFASVFRSLYDSMNDAQRKKADEVFRRRVREASERQKS
jgi:hypothetical protein